MSNTFAKIDDHIRTQSASVLSDILVENNDSPHCLADSYILEKILSNKKVERSIKSLKDELEYHGLTNDIGTLNTIILAIRLGLRIGAYYEIEDHKQNDDVLADATDNSLENIVVEPIFIPAT